MAIKIGLTQGSMHENPELLSPQMRIGYNPFLLTFPVFQNSESYMSSLAFLLKSNLSEAIQIIDKEDQIHQERVDSLSKHSFPYKSYGLSKKPAVMGDQIVIPSYKSRQEEMKEEEKEQFETIQSDLTFAREREGEGPISIEVENGKEESPY